MKLTPEQHGLNYYSGMVNSLIAEASALKAKIDILEEKNKLLEEEVGKALKTEHSLGEKNDN